jgi:hypothetical protein
MSRHEPDPADKGQTWTLHTFDFSLLIFNCFANRSGDQGHNFLSITCPDQGGLCFRKRDFIHGKISDARIETIFF